MSFQYFQIYETNKILVKNNINVVQTCKDKNMLFAMSSRVYSLYWLTVVYGKEYAIRFDLQDKSYWEALNPGTGKETQMELVSIYEIRVSNWIFYEKI